MDGGADGRPLGVLLGDPLLREALDLDLLVLAQLDDEDVLAVGGRDWLHPVSRKMDERFL